MLPFSPRIFQCMRQLFVKRPKFFAATSNLLVEQNLVDLSRFLHFSQKVVGVTLNEDNVDGIFYPEPRRRDAVLFLGTRFSN